MMSRRRSTSDLSTRNRGTQIGVQVFKAECKLIRAQLLRTCPELSALKIADDESKTFNFRSEHAQSRHPNRCPSLQGRVQVDPRSASPNVPRTERAEDCG